MTVLHLRRRLDLSLFSFEKSDREISSWMIAPCMRRSEEPADRRGHEGVAYVLLTAEVGELCATYCIRRMYHCCVETSRQGSSDGEGSDRAAWSSRGATRRACAEPIVTRCLPAHPNSRMNLYAPWSA